MRSAVLLVALLAAPVFALTPAGQEFLEIARQLEPVHCEKRKLRRAIVLAEVEQRHAEARQLKERFAALDRDPRTAKLEQRLAVLEKRISDGRGGVRDPEDLDAISAQQRRAFYFCE